MLSNGVDIVEIARVARTLERFTERFLQRVYTPAEVQHCRKRPAELAVRFAAKEAVAKTLGVGMRMLYPTGVGWQEVEILNLPTGKPYVVLHGQAEALAQAQGLDEWAVSLSHDGGLAIAFVVAMGRPDNFKNIQEK